VADAPVRSAFRARPLPRRHALPDDIYDALREALLSNELPPGQKLNLDQIARDLGVSNTPVRQALSRLEADGLVSKEPFKGYVSSPLLDTRRIDEAYEYRLLIEPHMASRAARLRSEDDVRALQQWVHEVEGGLLAPNDEFINLAARRDYDFHVLIATAAGNEMVREGLERVFARMRLYGQYSIRDTPRIAETWQEHQLLLDAIRAGDAVEAERLMRAHLSTARERLTHAFE